MQRLSCCYYYLSTNEGKPTKVFETVIKNYGLVDIYD